MNVPQPGHVNQKQAAPLPALRQDLRLLGKNTDLGGDQLWMIYDPLRHRFTALDRKSFAMLEVWGASTNPANVIAAVWRKHAEVITEHDVAIFSNFLKSSGLVEEDAADAWRKAFQAAETYRTARLKRLLHGYLFFRIPLIDPSRFLQQTLAIVRPLATRTCFITIATLGLIGLTLVSREWDTFTAAAASLANLNGAMTMLVAVFAVKILHEFGHGYVATHYGCRVPSLGIAVVLGTPMLYTDVTDAWRLTSRRARLAIDAAGICVDLAVAALATFLWAFLPDGLAKSIAFSLATAGWILSLTINLNPFMKFDGYHLFADYVGAANLQSRASAMAQWRLRETLFGYGIAPPERHSRSSTRALAVFGWATWLYRLILFTGIAIAIYHYFFKLAGIILFVVEIGVFIVAPVLSELKAWRNLRRDRGTSRRSMLSAAVLFGLIVIGIVPWSTTITIPAVLEPSAISRVYVQIPAKIVSINAMPGQHIIAGTHLMTLASSELDHEQNLIRLRREVVQLRMARIASDGEAREMTTILDQERRTLDEQAAGLANRIESLRITAPVTGMLSEIAAFAEPGRWITPREPLAMVHSADAPRIRGYVDASDSGRIKSGAAAVFIPDGILAPKRTAVIASVATANAASIDQLELVENFGGKIPTQLNDRRQAIPLSSQYAVRATLSDEDAEVSGAASRPQVGVLMVQGDAQSMFARLWRRVLMVLVRESGF